MTCTLGLQRLLAAQLSTVLVVGNLLATVPVAKAADADATFFVRPHCIRTTGDHDDWMFGPIPSPGIIIDTTDSDTTCSKFLDHDEQTLKTNQLKVGDILDIQIVVQNPSKQPISRVRSWLSYDPNYLEGNLIEINSTFSTVTPNEKDFYPEEGYVKMEASTSNGPTDSNIVFARVQFTVKKTNSVGSPISFHDAQVDGHSMILSDDGSGENYILKEEPKVLLVMFETADDGSNTDAENDDTSSDTSTEEDNDSAAEPEPFNFTPPTSTEKPEEPKPESTNVEDASATDTDAEADEKNACVVNTDCTDGVCIQGFCEAVSEKKGDGETCTFNEQCESSICTSGICVPSLSNQIEPEQDTEAQKSAFILLQIQNLRVTTDGSSVYLAWDPLESSFLDGYNIYYGTESGRYIQRKSIGKDESSMTIRSLPLGVTYYFAVRARSQEGDETAFSREVSIEVGNPETASTPLEPVEIQDITPPKNPLDGMLEGEGSEGDGTDIAEVPGETGAETNLLYILLTCAAFGTFLAFRRQLVAIR